jgi:hypothetical protein
MTREGVLKQALALFNEYMPSQVVDDDISIWLDSFLDMYVSTFVSILPAEYIPSLISILPQGLVITPIEYKGGAIALPVDFLRLVSFKSNIWECSLGESDVITDRTPKRKLQENKFTAGNVSRPVVSIEIYGGVKSLCFWGYSQANAGYNCEYIKKCTKIEDILSLDDWVLTAYIYYMLSFIATTINEKDKSEEMMLKAKELLVNHAISPTQPVSFEPSKTNKQ